jgi:hypothetical protein
VVIGAFRESSSAIGVNGDQTDNSASGSGAAYVFVRSASAWSQQAYVKASNTEAGDGFGVAAVSGGRWWGSPVSFQVKFVGQDGTPLNVPLMGIGPVSSRTVDLNPGATAVLEAPNVGALVQGWVEATVPAGVIGYGVFRQSAAGRADQEAVVLLTPVSSQVADLIFDDTGALSTAVAFLNAGSQPAPVTITAYGVDGVQLGSTLMVLNPRSKQAVVLKDLSAMTGMAGKRGRVHFAASVGAVAVLGLRFGAEAFTSLPVTHASEAATSASSFVNRKASIGIGRHKSLEVHVERVSDAIDKIEEADDLDGIQNVGVFQPVGPQYLQVLGSRPRGGASEFNSIVQQCAGKSIQRRRPVVGLDRRHQLVILY